MTPDQVVVRERTSGDPDFVKPGEEVVVRNGVLLYLLSHAPERQRARPWFLYRLRPSGGGAFDIVTGESYSTRSDALDAAQREMQEVQT